MTVVTSYDPAGIATAGRFTVAAVPALDLDAPSLAAITEAFAFQCAIEEFNSTTSVSYVTRKKLCDVIGAQSIGEITYDAISLTIAADDPQGEDQEILTRFVPRSTMYLVTRAGAEHDAELTVGDKVDTYEVLVASVDRSPITTENGEEFGYVVNLAVRDRRLNVALVA